MPLTRLDMIAAIAPKSSIVMQGLLRDGGTVRLGQVPPPHPLRPNDVLIRVAIAGICRTDLYVADGRIRCTEPRVLGHELAGEVSQVGAAVAHVQPGERVTVMPLVPCSACATCTGQERGACLAPAMLGVDRDGGFAELVAVPAACVHKLPEDLPWQLGAYTEPVAAAMAVLHAGLQPGQRGLIWGSGRIAELTRRILAAHGLDVPVHDAHAATLPERGRHDFIIETVATHDSMRAMLELVAPGGTIVLKSRPAEPVALDIARAVRREITLRAVGYGSFEAAIALLAHARIQVHDLLGPVLPLARFAETFALARAGEARKVFLSLSEGIAG